MRKQIQLDDKPTILKIVIQTFSKEKIWIKVKDADRKNTYYTNRYAFVNGKETFFVYMPQAPEDAIVIIYNDYNGQMRRDDTFKVLEISKSPLVLAPLKASKKTKSFIKFAQEFADECGYLSATKGGDIYKSNNGRFRIDYFDVIRSHKTKRVVKTPARISQITGKIEVSAEQFRKYTIPMRMAILLHEYSHYYLNKNPSNEVEADLNGLKLYLELGYPKIDIYNVFLNVFKSSPSLQNKKRFKKLDSLVKKFKR
tara:strand:- start:1717 stop:2481 length:765 start_codon:yes stop_codon:yes gene_type:complete